MSEAPPAPTTTIAVGVKANKTLVAICKATVAVTDGATTYTENGTYSDIGSLVGDIQLPESERKVEKFRVNDADFPALMIGDPEMSAVELTIGYSDLTTYNAVAAFDGAPVFVKFTLVNGDWFKYVGALAKIGPVTGQDQGACVAKLSVEFSHLVASGVKTA